MHQLVLIRN